MVDRANKSGCKRLPKGNIICKSCEISGRNADGGLKAAQKYELTASTQSLCTHNETAWMHNYFRCSLESKRFSSSLSLIFPLFFFTNACKYIPVWRLRDSVSHGTLLFSTLSFFSHYTPTSVKQYIRSDCSTPEWLVYFRIPPGFLYVFLVPDFRPFFFFHSPFHLPPGTDGSFTQVYYGFSFFFSFLNTIVFSLIRFLLYLVVGSDYLTMIPHYFQRNRKHGVLQLWNDISGTHIMIEGI